MLDVILEQYHTHQMRLAVRNVRNHAIMEAKQPQTGAYWWLPTPDGEWELDIYYDSEFRGNTMHDMMWRKYVVERLAVLWNKDPNKLRRQIGDNYAGLPRGRVGQHRDTFIVSFGDDVPIKNGMMKVVSSFNLSALSRAKKVRILPDTHENMLAGDPEAVQRALGVNLGLKGKDMLEPWFDDDDDY